MLIRHREWGGNDLPHNSNTVREFIDDVIMNYPDKEKRYFRIITKQSYNGCRSLLIYIQDGVVKSHHSTLIEFNVNDIMDFEIFPTYSVDKIDVNEVLSVDCNNEKELEEQLIDRKYDRSKKAYSDNLQKSINKEKIKNELYKDNVDFESIKQCVQLLMEENNELRGRLCSLESKYSDLREENYYVNQRIKFLAKELGY